MNKLAARITTFLIGACMTVGITTTVFAAPKIEFAKETISGVLATEEFSFDGGKTWERKLDNASELDISGVISTKDTTFTYRTVGSTATSSLPIPARPAKPVKADALFESNEDTTKDVIAVDTSFDFKYDNSLWLQSPASGIPVYALESNGGGKVSVRTGATANDFASLPLDVTVAAKAAAPKAKYDIKLDSITGVTTAMEYQVGAKLEGAGKWSEVEKSTLTREDIDEKLTVKGSEVNVYVRVKETGTKTSSHIVEITVPKAITAPSIAPPDGVAMDMANEKIANVDATMEYRVMTAKVAATATWGSPAWSKVSGSEIKLGSSISPASANAAAVKSVIQVRTKATGDVPASPYVEFTMTKRPATPKAKEVTLDYTGDDEKMTLADTLEYKLPVAKATWQTGGEGIDIKAAIPKAKPAGQILIRVKGVTSTDAESPSVPPSLEGKGPKIAFRPAAPKAVYNAKQVAITKVNKKMEYKVGTTGDWTDFPGNKLSLKDWDSGNHKIYIRLKNTAKKPASLEQYLPCSVPKQVD